MNQPDMNKWLKWEHIEKFLDQPQKYMENIKWIEGFVRDVFDRTIPPPVVSASRTANSSAGQQKELSTSDVFETHTHVFIRVKIPKREDPYSLQVLVKTSHVKILGLIDEPKKTIKMPSPVNPKTAKARYRENVLQIQVRKRKFKDNYHEAYIEF
ncbi:Hsp20/alpha crystallin family protein [Paenibacillus sp. FJAT-26967]|uniref:Hsp20/alpha crystallin family protein n=1 Tax=Paenibacillus sp. FJAT-26967 TaxID=1729690 RepID=UPI0008380475|nr:Hsp20/alpha crystallin family protein [Paenibacillus sp. FJAT-26967]